MSVPSKAAAELPERKRSNERKGMAQMEFAPGQEGGRVAGR